MALPSIGTWVRARGRVRLGAGAHAAHGVAWDVARGGHVEVGAGAVLGRRVRFQVAAGGRVELGEGVVLGDGVRVHVGPGARVELGAGTRLGERCAVVARRRVTVGAACALGGEVVLVDARPVMADVEVPVRRQGLAAAPVQVGDGAMLDAGVVVGPGVRIGPAARVTVRSSVEADVAPGATVGGVPARAAGVPEPPVPASRRLVRRG